MIVLFLYLQFLIFLLLIGIDEQRPIVPIAEKTHTYLDILRERKKVKDIPTIITTPTSSTTTTTTSTTQPSTTGLFTFQSQLFVYI